MAKKAIRKKAPSKITAPRKPQATRLEAILIPPGWTLDAPMVGSLRPPADIRKAAGQNLVPAITVDLDADGLSYGFTLTKLNRGTGRTNDILVRVIADGSGLDLRLALIELENAILRAKEHG